MAEPARKPGPESTGNPSAQLKNHFDSLSLIVVGLCILNLLSIGGIAYTLNILWNRFYELKVYVDKKQTVIKDEDESPLGKELTTQNIGILYPMENFLVNLVSTEGPRFLQAQMELELSDPSVEEELSRKKAMVRDRLLMILSSRTYKELKDTGGMKRLKDDMLKDLNHLLTNGKIKDIYFTQFHFN